MMRMIVMGLLFITGCRQINSLWTSSPAYFDGETYAVAAESSDTESAQVVDSAQSTYQAYLTGRVYLFEGGVPVPLQYPSEPYTLGESPYGEPEGSTLGLHVAQFSEDERYLTAFGVTRDSDHAVYGTTAIVLVWETASGELLFAFHPQIDWVEAIDYDLVAERLILEGCAEYGGLTYMYPRDCDGRTPFIETYSLRTGEALSESR